MKSLALLLLLSGSLSAQTIWTVPKDSFRATPPYHKALIPEYMVTPPLRRLSAAGWEFRPTELRQVKEYPFKLTTNSPQIISWLATNGSYRIITLDDATTVWENAFIRQFRGTNTILYPIPTNHNFKLVSP